MPEIMGLMHPKYSTPVSGIWVMTGFAAVIGALGVYNSVWQTGFGPGEQPRNLYPVRPDLRLDGSRVRPSDGENAARAYGDPGRRPVF